MPADINITDEEIISVEKILLPLGKSFDQERIDFIKDLRTLDLQAVPGSGKTTALLAKLLILDKKLPFSDGSGILVLSHTNNAVDQIKNRIGSSCINLFQYPNFVGTIQSFVDEFLAKPYYSNKYCRKIFKIDDGIYNNTASNHFDNMPNNAAKSYLNRRYNPKELFISLRIDENMNLIIGLGGTIFLNSTSESPSYKQIYNVKEKIIKDGIIHFDEAYFLANLYLEMFPQIIKILQLRFRYVFVDEMQDMAPHQYDILEKIFYNDCKSLSIYQRIGDKNQAIYNDKVNIENCWADRDVKLIFMGSQRLTKHNAELVKYFGLDFLDIIGNNKNKDDSEIDIKPHLIIYDDNSIRCEVVHKFVSIIKCLQESGKFPKKLENPVKVISWRKENDDEHKTSLKNYCPCFKPDEAKPKILYDNLESYLYFYDKQKKTLEAIRKNILNALVHILRLEGIKDPKDRFYTKKNLLLFFKENKIEEYEKIKLHLFNWCMAIVRNNANSIVEDFRSYAKELINIIDSTKSCNKSKIFIEESNLHEMINESDTDNNCINCNINGKKIEINTVHSVKGETHTATLYLETFYDRGYGNFESERLRNQFINKQKVNETINKLTTSQDKIKQSAKMVYVGFSRPTHLLCFAVHKCRYDNFLSSIDKNDWEIVDISNKDNC